MFTSLDPRPEVNRDARHLPLPAGRLGHEHPRSLHASGHHRGLPDRLPPCRMPHGWLPSARALRAWAVQALRCSPPQGAIQREGHHSAHQCCDQGETLMRRLTIFAAICVAFIVGCGGHTTPSPPVVSTPTTTPTVTYLPPESARTPEGAKPEAPLVSLPPTVGRLMHIDAAGVRLIAGFE